jgi:hypothetical protein
MTTDELLAWMEAQPGADLCGPSITTRGMWRATMMAASGCEDAFGSTIIEAIRNLKDLVEQEERP